MIGVIDSGSGGANVINECLKHFNEDFVYLVDNKNCPYGNKNIKILDQIIKDNIDFLLSNFNLDILIIGCNTASSLINYKMLEQINLPVIKTFPNLKSLIVQKGDKLLFATKNTIKQSNWVKYYLFNYKFKTLWIKNLPKYIDEKLSKNCQIDEKNLQKTLKNSFINKKYKNIQNIALGCTHFKHIENEIKNMFNNKINIFECEPQVANICKFLIRKNKNKSSLKIILTSEDNTLKSFIQNQVNI